MGIVQEKLGKIKEKVKLPSRSRTISVFLCGWTDYMFIPNLVTRH